MWDVDLSDTDLDLLDKDIFSKHFVCLQDVFSVTISRLPRRLQDVLEDEKLLRWGRFEDVFKTSSRRLQDQQMLAGREVYFHEDKRKHEIGFLLF